MLTASDRIWLIRDISRRLAQEEWQIIDLSLRQFGFPWTDNWTGDKISYIIEMLDKATDEKLTGIAEHLGCEVKARQVTAEPEFWKANHFKLFISHLSNKRKEIGELQTALSHYQIASFVAHKDIVPTKEWEDEILVALNTADAALACLHDGFHQSNWTDQECGLALGRGLLCIAVSYGDAPYGFLGRFQAMNGLDKDPPILAQELFEILLNHKQTRMRMREVLVRRFVDSDSFAEAKANVSILEKISYFDERLISKLKEAVENNYQIAHAFGVPERVAKLIKREVEIKKGA